MLLRRSLSGLRYFSGAAGSLKQAPKGASKVSCGESQRFGYTSDVQCSDTDVPTSAMLSVGMYMNDRILELYVYLYMPLFAFIVSQGSNVKHFKIYRWDPEVKGQKPYLANYAVNLDE